MTASGISEALLARICAVAIVLVTGAMLFLQYVPAYYAFADEAGYMVTAKMLALHGTPAYVTDDPYSFIPETLTQVRSEPRGGLNSHDTYFLRQPIGFPLLLCAAWKMGGSAAAFVVSPLAAIAAVLGLFLLLRCLLPLPDPVSALVCALAALLLGLHPVFLYFGERPLSHAADLALTLWGFVIAVRAGGRPSYLFAAAVVIGFAVCVRYTNLLLIAPLLACVWQGRPRFQRFARPLAATGLGLAVGLLPVLIYQAIAFGSPLATGYGRVGHSGSFGWGWFSAHLPIISSLLVRPGFGLFVLPVIAIATIAWMFARREWKAWFLFLWIVPQFLLYTAYFAPTLMQLLYLRLFLPLYPPLIAAVVLGGFALAGMTHRRWPLGVCAALLVITACVNILVPGKDERETMASRQRLQFDQTSIALLASELVAAKAEPDSLILADNDLGYFLTLTTNDVVYDPNQFSPEWVAFRAGTLKVRPLPYDPVRTAQSVHLLGDGTLNQPQLDALLRSRIAAYLARGRHVYLIGIQQPPFNKVNWAERLSPYRLTPVGSNALNTVLYEIH